MWDLSKATAVCGALAVLIYTCPVISQALILTLLALLWLLYVHSTFRALRRK